MQLCFLVSICKLVNGAQIIDEYSDIRSLRHVNIRSLKTSIRCSPTYYCMYRTYVYMHAHEHTPKHGIKINFYEKFIQCTYVR